MRAKGCPRLLKLVSLGRLFAFGLLLLATGCAAMAADPTAEGEVDRALSERAPDLMALPGVVGAGRGECAGAPCISVLVVEKTPDLVARIETILAGQNFEIRESGEVRAQPE